MSAFADQIERLLAAAKLRQYLRSRKCGATTRKVTPCQMKPVTRSQRCRLHGGLSTGPRTPEGRERIAEAQRRRWAA
ncbi:MAG: hypothetical protein N2B03_03125, partial [Boseongicola sp.]